MHEPTKAQYEQDLEQEMADDAITGLEQLLAHHAAFDAWLTNHSEPAPSAAAQPPDAAATNTPHHPATNDYAPKSPPPQQPAHADAAKPQHPPTP